MGVRKPQSYFAFRHFTIHQEYCGMKVSTDACIQGAWLPLDDTMKTALDIGAGTGLLSLMLAQRSARLQIDAVELNAAAARQAAENVAASSFADCIRVINSDAKSLDAKKYYDLIICNPPFFANDLAGEDAMRNAARHDVHLTASEIVVLAQRLLQQKGTLCIMWPERRMREWEQLMKESGFRCFNKLSVRNKEGARISSVISVWRRSHPEKITDEELLVRNSDGGYTPAFIGLLKDFYLRF